MKVSTITGAKGFDYDDSPQRSPRWLDLHTGRVGASTLGRWLSVSKRDGKPLKARSDLEKEIAFSKAFNQSFSTYTTGAMQAGIDNEPFVREQYEIQSGNKVRIAGCFYNPYFIASPDGLIGDDGGLEIKWLQDTNWAEVVLSGKPLDEHYAQIQGNLYASGRKWWDYVAASANTGRFVVLRIERDEEMIAEIAESVKAVAEIAPMNTDGVFQFNSEVPTTTNEEIWT